MNRSLLVLLIVLGAFGVGFADVLMKKVAVTSTSFSSALKNPLILAIALLYLLQIILYLYVLVKKYELGVLGILQSVVYILVVVGSGVIFFKENLSLAQKFGVLFAGIGIILLNL